MNRLCLFLTSIVALTVSARATTLGGVVDFTAVKGWHETPPDRPSPLPTIVFAPDDDRNAKLLITLFPAKVAKVTDEMSLVKFHREGYMVFAALNNNLITTGDLPLQHGHAVYTSFEDPELVGKPPQRGNYKFSTPITGFIPPSVVLSITLFTDSLTAAEFKEGVAIVGTAKLIAKAPVTRAPNPGRPPANATPGPSTLLLQVGNASLSSTAAGLRPQRSLREGDPHYFFVGNDQDVMLSGWLVDASGYPGFRPFWVHEKQTFEKGSGYKIENETIKLISGWNAVYYSVNVNESTVQLNIRACRIQGDTWADVHISKTGSQANWPELEAMLKSVSLTKN